jgi:ribosomal-protein-serine acetyltransferase
MVAMLKAGRGLELRPLLLKDARALFQLVDANRNRLRRWLPWVDDTHSQSDTRAYLLRIRALAGQGLASPHGLWWRDRLVGAVAFNWIDRANGSAGIGYWLAQEAEGHGLMTAAVAALLRHGFHTLKLNRIEIHAAVRNRRSRAIPQRLGFRHEGTLHQAEFLCGHFVDHAVYGLLARDWRDSPSRQA